MLKVGVDTGGTFTDFVFFDGERLLIHKVLSTPSDPSEAILKGIEYIYKDALDGLSLIHGSTVATNALLERKGAKVVLITTKGFEDVVEIGRQNRDKLYDLFWDRKNTLVEKKYRLGIDERTNYKGEILVELSDDEITFIIEKVKSLDVETIAISLINSYVNPYNENKIELSLEKLGLPISTSSKIIPEFREYESTSTTLTNSYLIPKVKSYMKSLTQKLKDSDVFVMQSNGGVISPEQGGNEPVRIITSGPAGGVVGGFKLAQLMGLKKIMTYDMGGTSTDISLCDGALKFTTESVIDGIPIKIPMIEVSTIGAGGGSIAYIDSGGAIKVGPKSAGADPGPACYGKGELPTVTDANLVLGRIDPEWFLAGRMKVFQERSESAIGLMGNKIDLSLTELSEMIIKISNSNMERALRVISIGNGYDPRDFSLISFGGAGGLHACELVKSLGIKNVVFPYNPGVLSALGMLMADSFKDYSQSYFTESDCFDIDEIDGVFEELYQKAVKDFPTDEIVVEKYVDARYKRQSHELNISFSADYTEIFHKTHEAIYGYSKRDDIVEIVTVRLRAIVGYSEIRIPELKKDKKKVLYKIKNVFFNGVNIQLKVYNREDFYPDFIFSGPSLILEDTSTLFIPYEFKCEVDERGSIIARI